MKTLLSLFLFTCITAYGQADLKKLDQYYTKALKDWNIPGMSIAIVKDGKIIFSKGYGTKEMGKSETPDENTLYAIASNSKAFTASAFGKLVDAGKISWDDKVTSYLPWFELSDPWVTNAVTIRDILSHRVGLGTFSGDLIWYRSNLTDDQIIRRVRYLPLDYSFRAGFGYSNVMFITAGEILERVTGQTWADYIQKEFFIPLGMTRSIVGIRNLKSSGNFAIPHLLLDGKHKPMEWEDWENVSATGGILSSVKDMSQWMIFHLDHGVSNGDTLLSSSAHNMTWTPHNNYKVDHTSDKRTGHFAGYGLGWGIGDYHGKFRVGHTGGYSGMVSAVAMLPDEKLGVVVLTNGMKPIYSALVNYTLDAFTKAPVRDWSKENLERYTRQSSEDSRIRERISQRTQNTKPSIPREKITGDYHVDVYGTISVEDRNGQLKIIFEHTPDLTATLEHWHYDTWKLEWDHPEVLAWFTFGTVKFNSNNNGEVTGLSFDVPNDDFWFEEFNAMKK